MSVCDDARLHEIVREQPYPLLFVTLSGAHLYGFPSPDSDFDLRGVHVLPVGDLIGLGVGRETVEVSGDRDGMIIDLVTHDVRKFCRLLLKNNGYVLEQLYSPLVVATSDAHATLKTLARGCVTRHHAHHYLGFARRQWELFETERPRRIKPLLYVYRVLLTGIHLMHTGVIEANLMHLNAVFKLAQVDELLERKRREREDTALGDDDISLHRAECDRLTTMLESAREQSTLPESPSGRAAIEDFVIRTRLGRIPDG